MLNNFPINKTEKFEVETPNFWNNIYQSGRPAWGNDPAEILKKFVKYFKRKKILDIGCGNGRNSLYLSELNYDVTGIDISRLAIEQATQQNSNCKFILLDLMNDEWPDEKYDVIIDFGLFHFVPEKYRKKYVQNIKSHLISGGVYCNQSGRLDPENPIIVKDYAPPQLSEKDILATFEDFKFLFLEKDVLPPVNGYRDYPCWNFILN